MKKATIDKSDRFFELIVLFMYGLFVTYSFLHASAFDFAWSDTAHNALRGLMLSIIAGKYITGWIKHGFTKPLRLLILVAIAACLVVSRLFNSVGSLIDLALLVLALRDVDFKKVLKLYGALTVLLLVLAAAAAFAKRIEDYPFFRGEVPRFSFGTLSPLDFATYICILFLVWWCIRRDRLSWWEIGAGALITACVHILCDTKTSTLILALTVLAAIIVKLTSSAKKGSGKAPWLLVIIGLVPVICAVFIIAASFLYHEEGAIWQRLNSVLNDRLSFGRTAFDRYGVSLFGRVIETTGAPGTSNYFYIDSSYVFILLRYGIFAFLGSMALVEIPALHLAKKRDAYAVLSIAFIAIHAVMEHQLTDISFNPFLVLAVAEGGLLSSGLTRDVCTAAKAGKKTAVKVAAFVLLAAFAASTVYLIVTAGQTRRFETYNYNIQAEPSRTAVADAGTIQEVFFIKDASALEIKIASESAPGCDYVFEIYDDTDEHHLIFNVPKDSIKAGEYLTIDLDPTFMTVWLTFFFRLYPVDAQDAGNVLFEVRPAAGAYCASLTEQGKTVTDEGLTVNMVWAYNDIRMMVWIFEITSFVSIAFLYFQTRRRPQHE